MTTEKRCIKFIIHAFEWFDSVNGNTYHSARVIRTRDNKTLYIPFGYGSYGLLSRVRITRAE